MALLVLGSYIINLKFKAMEEKKKKTAKEVKMKADAVKNPEPT